MQEKQQIDLYNQYKFHATRGDDASAIEVLNRSLELDPTLHRMYYFRGLSHLKMHAYKKALADFQQADTITPNNTEYLYALALAYEKIGNNLYSKHQLSKLLVLDHTNLNALNKLIKILYNTDEYTEALEIVEYTVLNHPYDKNAYISAVEILKTLGEFERSLHRLDQLIELDQSNKSIYLRHKGHITLLMNKQDVARFLYDRAISVDPTNPEMYYKIGLQYLESNLHKQALDMFIKSLKKGYDAQAANTYVGYCYALMAQYGDALDHLNAAVDLGANDNITCYAYGLSTEHEVAIDFFQKALTIDPLNVDALVNLARVYGEDGRTEEAADTYSKAVALNPQLNYHNYSKSTHSEPLTKSKIYKTQAVVQFKLNNFSLAQSLLDKAITIDPLNADAHSYLCAILIKNGKYTEALEQLQHVIEISPQNSLAYTYIGDAYIQLEDYEKAHDALAKALDIDEFNINANKYMVKALLNLEDYDVALGYIKNLISSAISQGIICQNTLKIMGSREEILDNKIFESKKIELYSKIESLNSQLVSHLNNAACCYIKLGEYDDAADDLYSALTLDPDNLASHILMGTVERTFNPEKSLKHYREALKLSPSLEHIKDQIDSIESEFRIISPTSSESEISTLIESPVSFVNESVL